MTISTLVTWVMDPIGVITLILAIIAIGLGIWTLIKRNRETSLVSCCFLAGIACIGVALSAMQVLKVSINPLDHNPVDPVQLINNYVFSAYPATWVLFGCGSGFLMSAFSMILPKATSDTK